VLAAPLILCFAATPARLYSGSFHGKMALTAGAVWSF